MSFTPETKQWLLDKQPWPVYVTKDFAELAKLNDKIRALNGLNGQ